MKKKLLALGALVILLGLFAVVPASAMEIDGSDPRDPDLVYLEMRPALDETVIAGHGVPSSVQIGIFKGLCLPIWNAGGNQNEELYFNICVPDRYDGEHDIVVEIILALSDAGEQGNTYQLDLNWEKVTPEVEVVPVAFHSVSAQRYTLSNLQYYCYRDFFVVDYDAPAVDPIIAEDLLAIRLRLGSVGGQYSDLNGELIILHVGVLFPRGDLLGDPEGGIGDIIDDLIEDGTLIGGEEVEEVAVAIQHYVFLTPLMFLSVLAFWRHNALMFMLAAGMSAITGFYWYDVYTTNWGLAIGILLVAYALICLGFAMQCMFWKRKNSEE